jgi:hypothetical protein
VGDASGVISSWDVTQSTLITAAQAHEGPVSSVNWSSSGGSSSFSSGSGGGSGSSSSVVACGYDGAVSLLQADHSIAKLYSAAFTGLYYSCKKSNEVSVAKYRQAYMLCATAVFMQSKGDVRYCAFPVVHTCAEACSAHAEPLSVSFGAMTSAWLHLK